MFFGNHQSTVVYAATIDLASKVTQSGSIACDRTCAIFCRGSMESETARQRGPEPKTGRRSLEAKHLRTRLELTMCTVSESRSFSYYVQPHPVRRTGFLLVCVCNNRRLSVHLPHPNSHERQVQEKKLVKTKDILPGEQKLGKLLISLLCVRILRKKSTGIVTTACAQAFRSNHGNSITAPCKTKVCKI